MPTTLTSVLLYAILLLPGIAYVHESERKHPSAKQSAFRETSKALTVSLVTFGVMLVGVLLLSTVSELVRDAFIRFVRDPAATVASYPRTSAGILLAYLLSSVSFVILAANKGWWVEVQKKWSKDEDIIPESAWVSMLGRDLEGSPLPRNTVKYANVILKSGRRIRGQIATWSPRVEDDLEKALVLLRPIEVKSPDKQKFTLLRGVDKTIIHASEIEYFTVLFGDKEGNRLFDELPDRSESDDK